MFFILLAEIKSATSADLLPPYYLASNNISGSWQFSGGSIIHEDYVVLLPPIQYYKGCAWSIVPPPSMDWSIYFHLNITSETGGGGFCIWLIESHGADGPFYGGPTQFRGVALVGAVSDDDSLKLKLVESGGNETFSIYDTNRDEFDFVYDISNESIILHMSVGFDAKGSSHINVSFLNNEFDSESAISKRINVSLSRAWLGITASNSDKASKIILSAARFSIFDPFAAMQHGRQKPLSIRVTSPLLSYEKVSLRNPSFFLMKKEISSYKANKGKITQSADGRKLDEVLNLIDECNNAFEKAAQYKSLNNFLRKTLIPYAEKWQRRAFKVISASRTASDLFSDCFNQTKYLLSVFNQSIVSTSSKTDSKLSKLNDDLFENIVDYAANNQKLHEEVVEETSIWWISFLKYFAIAEVVLVALFFVWQTRKNR